MPSSPPLHPAAVSILSHIFPASSLLLVFPRSHPGGISRNECGARGVENSPARRPSAFYKRRVVQGWAGQMAEPAERVPAINALSTVNVRWLFFLSFFLKAEIYLGSTCSNYRLGQILTSGNRAGGKKILWRAQACVGPCCICPTIISGATLAAGWNVAVNRKYTIRVLKYESGAGTKSRQQTDFPC